MTTFNLNRNRKDPISKYSDILSYRELGFNIRILRGHDLAHYNEVVFRPC